MRILLIYTGTRFGNYSRLSFGHVSTAFHEGERNEEEKFREQKARERKKRKIKKLTNDSRINIFFLHHLPIDTRYSGYPLIFLLKCFVYWGKMLSNSNYLIYIRCSLCTKGWHSLASKHFFSSFSNIFLFFFHTHKTPSVTPTFDLLYFHPTPTFHLRYEWNQKEILHVGKVFFVSCYQQQQHERKTFRFLIQTVHCGARVCVWCWWDVRRKKLFCFLFNWYYTKW